MLQTPTSVPSSQQWHNNYWKPFLFNINYTATTPPTLCTTSQTSPHPPFHFFLSSCKTCPFCFYFGQCFRSASVVIRIRIQVQKNYFLIFILLLMSYWGSDCCLHPGSGSASFMRSRIQEAFHNADPCRSGSETLVLAPAPPKRGNKTGSGSASLVHYKMFRMKQNNF